MALLGKISAVITANATDFTRTIGTVKSELNGLQKRVQGYRLNLDTAALDKTLTKLQLFRRTLQEAVGKRIDIGPLQDLYKAVEDIGKPLTKVKGQIESLSNSTQAYLYPALEKVQKGFQNLYRDIESGATTFDASRGRIEQLTRALERLKASTAVVSDFSKATANLSTEGAGGSFVQPRALQELKRAAELRKKASELPAASREDPFFQGMVRDAAVAAERIEALAAKVERAKLRAAAAESVIARSAAAGTPAPAAALRVAASAASDQLRAQQQLDRETEAQAIRNRRLSDRISLSEVSGMRNPVPQKSDAEKSAESAAKAINALRSANPGLEPYAQQLINLADAAIAAGAGTTAAAAALAKLNAQAESGQRLASATSSLNKINDDARKTVNSLKTDRERRKEEFDNAKAAGVPAADISSARRREFLGRDIGGRVSSLQGDLSGLSKGLSGDLEARLSAARKELERLVNTKTTPAASEIRKLSKEVKQLEEDTAKAKKQQALLGDFDSSTAMNLQPRAIKDYTNDFQLLLNLAGSLNEEAGTKFAGALEQSKAKVRGLAEEIARIKLGPATAASAKEVERLLEQIRNESKALARELAGLDPARFSEAQLNKLFSANRRLRGDISGLRGNAMQLQLGLQQAAFAVDDFFSATGGMEYKLRAISNNISQLGFVLGGTSGLIAGVALTVGTQLLLQFSGIGKASKESEGGLKSLNDEMEKSRTLAEQNTKAFQDMVKALKEVAVSGPRGGVEKTLRELRDNQKKQREAEVLSRSPEVAAAAGKRAVLEDELSKARGSDRVRLRREVEDARREEERVRRRAVAPRTNAQATLDAQSALERARAAEASTLESRQPFLGLSAESKRSERLQSLQRERIARPADAQDAARQIEARIQELLKTQAGAPFGTKFASGLPRFAQEALFPGQADRKVIDSFSETEKVIEQLDSELTRLKEVIRNGADDLVAQFAEQVLIAKEEIGNTVSGLASLGIDADVRGRLQKELDAQANALADATKKIEERLKEDPSANIDALKTEADKAAAALEALYQQADRLARDVALGSLVPTSARLADAASAAGEVGGPTMAGSNAARVAQQLREAEQQRERAALRNDDAAKAAADAEVERIRNLSSTLQEAAIAVQAFQRAAEQAGLALGRTLVGEAQSEAEQMRRRANRLASDPIMAGSAAAESDAARKRLRDEQNAQRQLEEETARARLAFERSRDPEVDRLARDVRAGRDQQRNLGLPVAEQLAGKERADRAQAELDRRFEGTAAARELRRKADERDQRAAAERERIRKANEPIADRASALKSLQGNNTSLALGMRNTDGVAISQSLALARRMDEARKKVEEANSAGVAIPEALSNELDSLSAEIEKQRKDWVDIVSGQTKSRAAGFNAQSRRAEQELDRAGVFASGVQEKLTDAQVQRDSLVKKRDDLVSAGREKEAAAVQTDIDKLDELAAELNAAAIAVAGFQQAANKAALDLQRSVESEARGAADNSRRRANEAEAQFGAGSPEAKRAREEQARREKAFEQSTEDRLKAEEDIANARAQFEQNNPAARRRAEEIRQLEQDAAKEYNTPAAREAARAKAERLRREQEAEFSQDPEVKRQRRKADEADIKARELDSAARGAELMKTERQKREEELRSQAADIGARARQMRDEGAAPRDIQAGAQIAANNLARGAAPMLAQFADEVMNARLSGPSRAALNATDVQTTEGAKELNRLLRGDDAAKDVNLQELRKQSQLLQAIEDALRKQGIVVEL